jgi:hypothetical protein
MLDAMETLKGKHAWTYENINVGQFFDFATILVPGFWKLSQWISLHFRVLVKILNQNYLQFQAFEKILN